MIATAIAGSVAWFVYWVFAEFVGANCGGPDAIFASWTGGVAGSGSLWAAALLGVGLWSAAGVAACSLRRQLGLILLCFVASYALALVILGVLIAPLIWGPRACT